jgi:hypothetical protein
MKDEGLMPRRLELQAVIGIYIPSKFKNQRSTELQAATSN